MPSQHQLALGFDFGLRRIGVAVGQALTASATPLAFLLAKEGIPNWQQVDRLIQEWRPNALVVGIPVHMDGSEQPITHAARRFLQSLQERYGLPVYPMDERLTTNEARNQLFNARGYKALKKGEIDSIAAQIILTDWLKQQG